MMKLMRASSKMKSQDKGCDNQHANLGTSISEQLCTFATNYSSSTKHRNQVSQGTKSCTYQLFICIFNPYQKL